MCQSVCCMPSSLCPEWDCLTDRDQVLGYVEKLKRCSVGVEGRLVKLLLCVQIPKS